MGWDHARAEGWRGGGEGHGFSSYGQNEKQHIVYIWETLGEKRPGNMKLGPKHKAKLRCTDAGTCGNKCQGKVPYVHPSKHIATLHVDRGRLAVVLAI